MRELIEMIDNLIEKKESRKERRNRKIKPTGDPGLEKDGGKRKRRTAYSSGRREMLFDTKRKKFLASKSDLKKIIGLRQKKTKGVLGGTGMKAKHRWKAY